MGMQNRAFSAHRRCCHDKQLVTVSNMTLIIDTHVSLSSLYLTLFVINVWLLLSTT